MLFWRLCLWTAALFRGRQLLKMQWENRKWDAERERATRKQTGCTNTRAPFPARAHTHISGNDAFEVLNREDYHDTHTHTHVHNIWAHIMSLLLRSWPFCDIWKGQKEHHSRTHTHTHTHTRTALTSTPSGVSMAPPHRSSILRLTSGAGISLLLQGLDSTHSFHLAVP